MKTGFLPITLALSSACWLLTARAGVERPQAIQLHAGWNAVFLEVQPASLKPDDLFSQLPVDTVASFFPGQQEAQYLRNPGDAPWRDEGWLVWYAPSKPEAFLSTLHAIQAFRPFMVHARTNFTWTVSGEARATSLAWHPNTCTFTGLPVDPAAPPTFAQFFAGSPAHQRLRIFRLQNDTWSLITSPATDRVQSGEAYWIQTDGASVYQGPLRIKLPAAGQLAFDLHGTSRTIEFANEAAGATAQVKIEVVSQSNTLPLRTVARDASTLRPVRTALPGATALPPIAPGQSTALRIEPNRDAMPGSQASTLLRVTDGRGTQQWIPVSARQSGSDGISAALAIP